LLVARAARLDLDDPGALAAAERVEKLELGVGTGSPVGVRPGARRIITGRRLGAVGQADQLEDALAAVDLLLQPGAQFAVAGGKVVLGHGVEAQPAQGVGDQAAGTAQFGADGGDEQAWAVHRETGNRPWLAATLQASRRCRQGLPIPRPARIGAAG